MNPTPTELRRVLSGARTIAVVGLSDNPERYSNEVARYLVDQGYRVIPVNPTLREVLGEPAYPSVTAIPPDMPVDIVDIFRRSEEVPEVMDEAIERKVPVVWMQVGISNASAAAAGRRAGVEVVENLCIMTQHHQLGLRPLGADA
jgi:uncharacterized protein